MSEWVPADRPRPIRILALPSPPHSAASFRAFLGPLLKALPQWYEVHFLEAPFCIPEVEQHGSPTPGEGSEARLKTAICDVARLQALRGEQEARRILEVEWGLSEDSSAGGPQLPDYNRDISALEARLSGATDEDTKAAWSAFTSGGSIDEAETLLARQGLLPLERDWAVLHSDQEGSRKHLVGLQSSLKQLGDYLREYGPFHIAFSLSSPMSSTSSLLLRLLSSLLQHGEHHPQSVFSYPSLFPLLPLSGPAPRMGGWEVMPSVPVAMGSKSRRHAVVQGQFEAHVRFQIGPSSAMTSSNGILRDSVVQWETPAASKSSKTRVVAVTPPVQADPGATEDVLISLDAKDHAGQAAMSEPLPAFLATYLRSLVIAHESVPGLNPHESRLKDQGEGAAKPASHWEEHPPRGVSVTKRGASNANKKQAAKL